MISLVHKKATCHRRNMYIYNTKTKIKWEGKKRGENAENGQIPTAVNMQISSTFLLLLHTSCTPRIKHMKNKMSTIKMHRTVPAVLKYYDRFYLPSLLLLFCFLNIQCFVSCGATSWRLTINNTGSNWLVFLCICFQSKIWPTDKEKIADLVANGRKKRTRCNSRQATRKRLWADSHRTARYVHIPRFHHLLPLLP